MKKYGYSFLRTRTLLVLVVCLIGCEVDPGGQPTDRLRSSAELTAFETCRELENALKQHLKDEMAVQLQTAREYYLFDGPEMEPPAAEPNPAPGDDASGGRTQGDDYSGTNNQEAGVDEADFVKTDGYAVYVLSGSSFFVLEVPEFGMLLEGDSKEIEGYPGQMLLYKETAGGRASKAVVFSSVYSWDIQEDHPLYEFLQPPDNATSYYRSTDLTKVTVLDLSDPDDVRVVRELYFEGAYQTARLVQSSVRVICYAMIDIAGLKYWPDLPPGYYQLPQESPLRKQLWDEAVDNATAYNNDLIDSLTLADLVPAMFSVTESGGAEQQDFTEKSCSNFIIAEDGVSRGFTSILSFDLLDEALETDDDYIVSNRSTVYASSDVLLIAEPSQNWWWYWGNDDFQEATNIHCFDTSEPGRAAYSGSGRIDGTVLGQFSLSEYRGYIRVAATTGQWNRWWLENPEEPENYIYILAGDNGSLGTVGSAGPIAKGERIWSARFSGDRAFLVTFRNIDPLWTIDLSTPENPEIMGELDVPGVSTYIHPVQENYLLTVGYGGDTEGLDWNPQVSLFDITVFDNATLVDTLPLTLPEGEGWESWASSEATWEHKAFQFWETKMLLAVPLSTYKYTCGPDYYYYEFMSTLALITVDPEEGLSAYGEVDHSQFYNSQADCCWGGFDIRRSIFMGDYIYAVGDRAVTASDIASLETTARVLLPGSDCRGPYPEPVTDEPADDTFVTRCSR